MIDIHSHILPNVDDGSESIEETIKLMQEAKKAGFEAIVSTSHYIEGYYETSKEERKNIISEISKMQNVPKIFLGNEIYLSENMINLIKQHKAITLNETKYVLFEMPLNGKPMGIYDMVYEMLQNKLIPVLAHPERYIYVKQNPNLIYNLIEKGVLMQGNYGSIIGEYGKKSQVMIKKFLENNMIHFLGSDVHKEKTIYTKIPQILIKLKQIIGEEKLEELTNTNIQKVLANEKIQIDEPTEITFTLKERMIMKLK